MKSSITILLLIGLSAYLGFGSSRGAISDEQFNSVYSSMKVTFTRETYGDGMTKIKRDFLKTVPENDQADVVAEVVERSAKIPSDEAVLVNAMNLAALKGSNHKLPWSERLEGALLTQIDSSDSDVRKRLVTIFLAHPESKRRGEITPVITSLLHDVDDNYRASLLSWVIAAKWPGAEQICDDYVSATRPEGTHKESVIVAKCLTNPVDYQRSISLSRMKGDADARKAYLSYIELHKNDPDYEVSVDMAERLSKVQ